MTAKKIIGCKKWGGGGGAPPPSLNPPLTWVNQIKMRDVHLGGDPTSPRIYIAIWLASFEVYLLLLLIHMSLLLFNYSELSFILLSFSLTKGQIYGSRLSHILNIPSTSAFPIWYTQYITCYTRYIISNVNFIFWKIWDNDSKCVIPAVLHSMLHLKNSSILECHIRAI